MSETKVYDASCHCGDVKYKVRLTFPPKPGYYDAETIRIYKCNCSTCHKLALFHLRPIHPADDFIVTCPTDIEELGSYSPYTGFAKFYFCKKCGTRTFGLGAYWEQVDLDVEKWAGNENSEGKVQKVWKSNPKDLEYEVDGKKESKTMHYVSVNAVTIEDGQGIDLREWHDKGWIFYVQNRDQTKGEDIRKREPHPSGMY
ncbi:hypothetical protein P154DRAFT_524548 [Amniculicola lignicola CBS 123094]|uniref:CENP-V/GFA domain-containing protein n=1 Tax=Amniculicola lignicola CBS 123094 TaxID=1392246 RepID=A0A6A5WF90_9PLEO|nr:hypothetical protein P154DRAFT_524548 [Amniculicola lignicola CBS 123094]